MGNANTDDTVTAPTTGPYSSVLDLGDRALVGIQLPSALDSVAITFQASYTNEGNVFRDVTKVDGSAYSVTVAPSKYVVIPPSDLVGMRRMRLVMGTVESATRQIILISRAV